MNRREALLYSGQLLGYTITGTVLAGVLNGCQAPPALGWEPKVLAPEDASYLAEVCETILPNTDTPGAKDVGVDRYIDAMLHENYSEEERNAFLEGIKTFRQDCISSQGKDFLKLTPEERTAYLAAMDANTPPKPPSIWGISTEKFVAPPFWRSLKELTVTGYFTSEEVGKNVLRYLPIPGSYEGCIPYTTGERAWSL